MNDRERFIAVILGQPMDHVPYYLKWGPWATTWQRWDREGKPSDIRDHRALMDTDGQPERITPAMISAGVNLLFPLEVAAGCDINDWQHRFPELAFSGGSINASWPKTLRRSSMNWPVSAPLSIADAISPIWIPLSSTTSPGKTTVSSRTV